MVARHVQQPRGVTVCGVTGDEGGVDILKAGHGGEGGVADCGGGVGRAGDAGGNMAQLALWFRRSPAWA